jgi:hypothetical protein
MGLAYRLAHTHKILHFSFFNSHFAFLPPLIDRADRKRLKCKMQNNRCSRVTLQCFALLSAQASQQLIKLFGQVAESLQGGRDRLGAGHVDARVAQQIERIFAAPAGQER